MKFFPDYSDACSAEGVAGLRRQARNQLWGGSSCFVLAAIFALGRIVLRFSEDASRLEWPTMGLLVAGAVLVALGVTTRGVAILAERMVELEKTNEELRGRSEHAGNKQ